MKPTVYQKFYINILSGCQEKTESFAVVHDKIFCDVCGMQVNGYRYKCLQCDDYDLCEQCEQQHSHAQHLMLRVGQSNVSVSINKKYHFLFPFPFICFPCREKYIILNEIEYIHVCEYVFVCVAECICISGEKNT